MIERVLITGGGKGIGRGIATTLAQSGIQVGLIGRTQSALDEVKQIIESAGGKAIIATADLRQAESAQAAVDQIAESLGGLDGLINNAGQVIRKSIVDISMDEWHAMIETNINGVFYTTKACLPYLQKAGRAHIINVSSISGYMPLPGGSGYAASKYAVTGFSESIFQELRDLNIKVTTVFPGSVDSDSHRHEASADHSWKVKPEEVGEACLNILRTAPTCLISKVEVRPLNRPPK